MEDAYKIERAQKKSREREQKAFEKILTSKEGRTVIAALIRAGGLYEPAAGAEAEGSRCLVLWLRSKAAEYNLLPMWRKAEAEEEDFQAEIARLLREETEDEEVHF